VLWVETAARERNLSLVETVRAVRAGILCASRRAGEVPADLASGSLPDVCRLLASHAALDAVLRGDEIGYRRISPSRYRLCAGFAATPADLLPADLLPAVAPARVRCVEETVPLEMPAPPRRRQRATA
jgi:hypothetical protein